MTNTLELEYAIRRVGLTKRKIAKQLHLSEMGLHKKINNITEFKASEISELYEILKLDSLESQNKIFFAKTVDLNSTLTAKGD